MDHAATGANAHVAADAADASPVHAAEHGALLQADGTAGPAGSPAPDCPLGHGQMGATCGLAAAVRASASTTLLISAERGAPFPAPANAPRTQRAHAVFHPPRA